MLSETIAEVVPLQYLPRQAKQVFSYRIPDELRLKVTRYSIVEAPFRNKNKLGLVTAIATLPETPKFSLKSLSAVLPYPPLTVSQQIMAEELQSYYAASASLAYKTIVPMLPRKLKNIKRPKNFIQKSIKFNLTKQENLLLKTLEKNKHTTSLIGKLFAPDNALFLSLVAAHQKRRQQILLLFPDVNSLVLAQKSYKKTFGASRVAVWSSDLKSSEHGQVWRSITNRRATIILATRSGCFLPFISLGLIIIFQENNDYFKSWDQQPYYDARHCAKVLSQKLDIPLVTTSLLEPLTDPKQSTIKYKPAKQLIKPLIIDTKFNPSEITDRLVLPNTKPALIFTNRLGYAVPICQDCGFIARCVSCKAALIYRTTDKNTPILQCARSGHTEKAFSVCPKCHGPRFRFLGLGTERVAESLAEICPTNRLARFDSAILKQREDVLKLIQNIKQGRVDIVVATTMIIPYLYALPDFSTVAVMNVESLFMMPDWRANERSLDILMHLWHMAHTQFLVTTASPEHPLMSFLNKPQWQKFKKEELLNRQHFFYPPYTKLITLTAEINQKTKDDTTNIISLINKNPVLKSMTITLGSKQRIIIKTPLNYEQKNIWERLSSSWKIDVDPISLG